MAYDFNGTTANLELASAIVTAAPLTLFARFTTDTVAAGTVTILSLGSDSGTHLFQLRRNGSRLEASTSEGATTAVAQTGTGITAGASHAGAAVFASSTSRKAYLAPTFTGTDTTSVTPTALNRTVIGGRYNSGAIGLFHDGTVSEFAVWNVAITDDDFASLFNGASPLVVKPASLVAYFPLIRGLNDLKAARAFTNTSATVVAHHKVKYPSSAI